MNSKNKREFNIEVIASVIEVCYLTDPNEVLEFCSFVIGKTVNPGNIDKYWGRVEKIIKIQYPNLKRTIFLGDGCYLKPHKIMEIINEYREQYGKTLMIKSISNNKIKKLVLN